MRTYTAKGPHKRPCDCCGHPILPGDTIKTWMSMNPEGVPGEGNFGNIMRAHAPCEAITSREMYETWELGQAFVGNTWEDDDVCRRLQNEAYAGVTKMRKTPESAR